MDRNDANLLDISHAARLVLEFTVDMDKETFLADLKTQSAVLHQLMVIGEATKRLAYDFRTRHPQVPWSLLAGMRDKLIHGYDIVDFEEVWHTAMTDIPTLLSQIEPLLPVQE